MFYDEMMSLQARHLFNLLCPLPNVTEHSKGETLSISIEDILRVRIIALKGQLLVLQLIEYILLKILRLRFVKGHASGCCYDGVQCVEPAVISSNVFIEYNKMISTLLLLEDWFLSET